MMLSKLIVTWLDWIIEIGLWLFLITAFLSGFSYGEGFFGSIIGGVVALIAGGITAALVFGFFILLSDIRRMMKVALERLDEKPSAGA